MQITDRDWTVIWFNKKGSKIIVGSETILINDSTELRRIINSDIKDDPLFVDPYCIASSAFYFFQPKMKHQFDEKKYNYYIMAYQKD